MGVNVIAAVGNVLSAVWNMNHPGRYLHWWFITISVANLTVIALMIVTFALAILLPFPHRRNRQ
ncbi:MAG TPA: hypothetical protein VFA11_01760 [Acidimicrobiales bacterium]|nr:hypothetical protein [Acidimicrobiales bacterium]